MYHKLIKHVKTMKTLEQQIADLTAEHNFKAEMETLVGGYKKLAYLSRQKEYDFCLNINLREWPEQLDLSSQLKNIVHLFKPTKDHWIYDHSKKVTHYSPFKFLWNSEVRGNYVKISYLSNRIHVSIEMPISFYQAIARRSERTPNDCEDVYFGGMSRREINSIRIPVYQSLYYDNLAWYGGDYDTYIVDPEYREQFDNMVLTGELPLG